MDIAHAGPRRIALITGGGRNIGRAIALELASNGIDVVVGANARREEAEAVADEARGLGVRALGIAADIRDPAAVERMFADTLSALGPVAILVNNAAVRSQRRIEDLDVDEWRRVVSTTLDAAYLCARAAVAHMRQVGWGRIINIAGITGQTGDDKAVHLAAAKAGLIGLTKALAVELAPEGITVNAVSPGMIDTVRRAETAVVDADPGTRWVIPMKRRGTPAECAAAVGFLASHEASFITGVTLSVNGGTYIQ